MYGFDWIVWIIVGLAAILAGIVIARLINRTDGDFIQAGRCPTCKARKSLLATPVDRSRVIFTCGKCENQWLVENADGLPIVEGPAPRAVLPALAFRWSDPVGNPVFTTHVGSAEYDLRSLRISSVPIRSLGSPRELLVELHRGNVTPVAITLYPEHVEIVEERGLEAYDYFIDSAGIDLPFANNNFPERIN